MSPKAERDLRLLADFDSGMKGKEVALKYGISLKRAHEIRRTACGLDTRKESACKRLQVKVDEMNQRIKTLEEVVRLYFLSRSGMQARKIEGE